jgi:hypothetical protein
MRQTPNTQRPMLPRRPLGTKGARRPRSHAGTRHPLTTYAMSPSALDGKVAPRSDRTAAVPLGATCRAGAGYHAPSRRLSAPNAADAPAKSCPNSAAPQKSSKHTLPQGRSRESKLSPVSAAFTMSGLAHPDTNQPINSAHPRVRCEPRPLGACCQIPFTSPLCCTGLQVDPAGAFW